MTNFAKSKLTIKDLSSPRNPPEDGTPKPLGRIFGIVTGKKIVKDAKGDVFIGLTGQFAGVKPDGDVIRSGICYLPGGFHDEILAILDAGEDGAQVKFAYDAFSRIASNPIGYEYMFRSLMKPAADDALNSMIAETGTPVDAQATLPMFAGNEAPKPADHKAKAAKAA